MTDIVLRLNQLAHAVAEQDWSEFSMRIPADPERDADLVIFAASEEIARLRIELAELRPNADRYLRLAWTTDTPKIGVYDFASDRVLFGAAADSAIDALGEESK